jgi:hypothetical protein
MSFKEPKRARRIRDRERMIARGRRVASRWHRQPEHHYDWIDRVKRRFIVRQETWDEVFEKRDYFARRNHDHLKVCSCYMCGNPRNRLGAGGYNILTMQELRALDSANTQLSDLEEDGEA